MAIGDEAPLLIVVGMVLAGTAFLFSAVICGRVACWRPAYLSEFPGGPLGYRVPVPLTGGLAFWVSTLTVFCAVALASVHASTWLPTSILRHVDGLWYRSSELGIIICLSTLALVAGLAIDLFGLGLGFRFGAQFTLAIGLVGLGTRVTLFWPFSHAWVGGAITVLWVVALINAFSFLDNLDGLATGVGLSVSLLFAAAQAQAGSLFAPASLLIVAGGLAGLWVYNRYPARLFLGTGGSWLLGFFLAAMTVAGTYYRYGGQNSRNSVLSPLLVMAVPFFESAVVFLVWLRERRQPFLYNPRLYSYRLRDARLSPRQSVGLLLLVSIGAGLGSVLLRRLDTLGTAMLLIQTSCLIAIVALLEVFAIHRWHSSNPKPRVLSSLMKSNY